MHRELINKVVNSVLYEGYMLYPYRRSSLKNQHRWNFGLVYPQGLSPNSMTTECLLEGEGAECSVEVRFLQITEQNAWQETTERIVAVAGAGTRAFRFDELQGEVRVSQTELERDLHKLRVAVENQTPRDTSCDPLTQTLASTHFILSAQNGAFVSLLDPPARFRDAAAACRNTGAWPVLVGREGDRDCMLASPIILYDYPRVANESPGDLFDCTEIDEILLLRILTLTDAEKEEMRRSGERERRLLEKAESLTPEQLMQLHGVMRDIRTDLKRGDRVRLRPKPGGDIFDVVLAGRVAIVESVQQDFENRTHVAVVIEDDPGMDLGFMRQPGHRFFFSADELERIA